MLNDPNTSGFGMDSIKKCITTEKVVWTSFLQSHPTHSPWQNRLFPFYDELLIIFEKDRASGTNVEGPADMVEDIQREETSNDNINNDKVIVDSGIDDFDDPYSPSHSSRNEGVHKQKKKRSGSSDNLTTADIKEVASIIGSEIAKASHFLVKQLELMQKFQKREN